MDCSLLLGLRDQRTGAGNGRIVITVRLGRSFMEWRRTKSNAIHTVIEAVGDFPGGGVFLLDFSMP